MGREQKAVVTVALPLFKAGDIAWLCLESLCEQKTIMPWELVICEEQTEDKFGTSGLESYYSRLKEAGCVDVNYVVQEKKIPLANKWRKIADYSADSSEVFIMCAADNYYQSLMIQQSYDGIVDNHADWFSTFECHFYDINTGKFVRYYRQSYSGIEMAMRIEHARNIRGSSKKKGVDSYIYLITAPKIHVWNPTDAGLKTVCTHGKNLISWNRGKLINGTRPPFRPTRFRIEDLLPEQILKRLSCLGDL